MLGEPGVRDSFEAAEGAFDRRGGVLGTAGCEVGRCEQIEHGGILGGSLLTKALGLEHGEEVPAGGLPGVKKAVDIFRTEIDLVMGQIGCPSLDQLGPDFLWQDDWQRNR